MDVCRPLVSDSHVIQTQGPGLASSVFDMTLATWYGTSPLASRSLGVRSFSWTPSNAVDIVLKTTFIVKEDDQPMEIKNVHPRCNTDGIGRNDREWFVFLGCPFHSLIYL